MVKSVLKLSIPYTGISWITNSVRNQPQPGRTLAHSLWRSDDTDGFDLALEPPKIDAVLLRP
jgi:hypothetical protein